MTAGWTPRDGTPRTAPQAGSVLVGGLYLLSGASALGLETTWFRALAVVLGAGFQAAALVLAVFMAGLAAGSAIGARLASRLSRPLAGYAVCELVVAISAQVFPRLVDFAGAEAAAFDAAVASSGWGVLGAPSTVLRIVLVLAPATMAMGASLPFASEATSASPTGHERGTAGRGVGLLYAANLSGGAAGALLAAFVVLPAFGLAAASRLFGGLAFAVTIAAAWLAARLPALVSLPPDTKPAVDAGPPTPGAPARTAQTTPRVPAPALETRQPLAAGATLAVAFAVGVVSFVLQVAWNRALSSLLGSSAITFALVVAVILASLAVGALRGRRDRDRGEWIAIARRLLALAVAIAVGRLLIGSLPFFLAAVARLPGEGDSPFVPWSRLGTAVLVVAAASYQVGALFPLLVERVGRVVPSHGRAAGWAAWAATLGNVGGALVAGFVLIPQLGPRATLALAAAVSLAGAATVAIAARVRHRAAATGVVVAAVLAAVVGWRLDPPWDAGALAAGTYRTALYRDQARRNARRAEPPTACGPGRALGPRRVLFARDGAIGTVVVTAHATTPADPPCTLVSLRVDGKTEGSLWAEGQVGAAGLEAGARPVARGDLPTQILAGLLPTLAVAQARDGLVVGWGTGLSLRAALDGGLAELQAVELEPVVVEAGRIFDAGLISDPRLRLVVGDGRMALVRAPPRSLDVVVSQPSNPWVTGSSALFSREYFAVVADRLRDDGAALFWVQLYEIDREAVRSFVATVTDSFADVHAFWPEHTRDLLLLARRQPATSVDVLARAVDQALAVRPRAAAALASAGLDGAAALRARHVGDSETLRRWSAGAPLLLADRIDLEIRVARLMLSGRTEAPEEILAGLPIPR